MKNRLTKLSLIVLTALFSVSASAQLKDGDYNAESKGVWGSPIKVNLSIKNGKIADIKFTHNETPAVGGSALDKIKADVLKSQNINVDAISGATATSKAALSALEAAFLKAGGSKAISKKTSAAKDKAYENTTTDVVVVGGGPGGMMAAIVNFQRFSTPYPEVA
ncbi:FMN-binding protein [Parasutterella sp.]|uniref:FMN-binding protein n=1 Tax=Parasutterella sp. TaxID=2049037 RepID=UPI00351FF84B